MKEHIGKTIKEIIESYNDEYQNVSVVIHFTDGTKMEITGYHDYDYVEMKII